ARRSARGVASRPRWRGWRRAKRWGSRRSAELGRTILLRHADVERLGPRRLAGAAAAARGGVTTEINATPRPPGGPTSPTPPQAKVGRAVGRHRAARSVGRVDLFVMVSGAEGRYVASAPGLPNYAALGQTRAQALANLREIVRQYGPWRDEASLYLRRGPRRPGAAGVRRPGLRRGTPAPPPPTGRGTGRVAHARVCPAA